MRGHFTLLFFCLALSQSFALSPEEASKFVDKYESNQKKILGFINCITHVLTGEDAIQPLETPVGNGKALATETPASLDGCFRLVGFKMGAGFQKLTALFSKEASTLPTAPPPQEKPALQETLKAGQNLIPERAPANEPVPKAANPPKIKTAW